MEKLIEALVTGLAQGAMIALVALGYTMVYGVLKLINFAHSEVFMMARVLRPLPHRGLRRRRRTRSSPAIGGHARRDGRARALLGIAVERVAYRPLRGRGRGALTRITPLVTALGMSRAPAEPGAAPLHGAVPAVPAADRRARSRSRSAR